MGRMRVVMWARLVLALRTIATVAFAAWLPACGAGLILGRNRPALETHTALAATNRDADETRERLVFLRARIADDRVVADRWRWGWTAVFGALLTFNVVRAIPTPGAGRDAGIVGGIGSLLGLGSVLLFEPRVVGADRELRAAAPRDTARADRDALLVERAERLLQTSALAEESFRSWYAQLGRAVFAGSLGLLLAFGFGRPEASSLNVGASLVIGQLLARTHPTGAVEAWAEYGRRFGARDPVSTGGRNTERSAIDFQFTTDGRTLGVVGTH